jgi:Zn-dependent protease/CBS domain-containing protein
MQGSIRLFSVRGIEIGVHLSWLVVFVLVTWSLSVGYFPLALPDAGPVTAWILGALAALLLFAAVLIHELAHSFVARWQGVEVHSITLFIFGGVSSLSGEARRPLTEFLIAIVGPLMSLAVAAVAFAVALAADEPHVRAVAEYLAFINVALAVFNLLPAFPLDGGRVLRSVVWSLTGSLRRATSVAAAIGRLAAWGFLAFGFFRLLQGDLIGGLWIAVLGWFLHNAASASESQQDFQARLAGLTVGDVIRPDPTSVPPDLTVDRLVDDYLLVGNRRAVPVALDGRVVGMVTVSDIQKMPAEERARTRVEEIMGGRDGVVSVGPRDSLRHAIDRLAEGDFEQLPVLDHGALVGVLSRAAVLRQLELRRALDVESEVGESQST